MRIVYNWRFRIGHFDFVLNGYCICYDRSQPILHTLQIKIQFPYLDIPENEIDTIV